MEGITQRICYYNKCENCASPYQVILSFLVRKNPTIW